MLKKHHLPDKWGSWDGDVNFEFLLENEDRFPRRLNTRNTLKALRQLKKTLKVSSPSPFYAVLLMDGDSLGSQMSDETKQTGISEALNAFTLGVPEQVSAHNGFLVYAGGDDVLALLPLEDALDCALSLRHFYAGCFQQVNDERSIHIVTSLGLDNATAGVSPVAAESVSHLLYAEYLQSSGIKTVNEEDHAPQLASFKRLESLCRQYIRTLDEDRVSFSEKEQWRADAALLVRFLATKGADNER